MNADATEASVNAVWALLNLEDPVMRSMQDADDQGHRYDMLSKLHKHFSCRNTPGWWMSSEDKQKISDYVKQFCADELETVMKTADEVVQQTFLFRFPWDMERSVIPVTFDGVIDWCHIPDQDVEWAYMLNRHRYWVALGQAYAMTGDEKYAAVFSQQLEDWMDRNPVPGEPTTDTLTWRPIEAGLRSVNWIKALRYVIGSPSLTPLLLGKTLISLHEHGEYLAASFTSWKHISNWGVLETSGLYHIALFFPEFSKSAGWREMGEERLKETASLQIMADGIHWEQSPTYHHEVLACYLDCIHLANLNGLELDGPFRRTVREMAEASLYWAKPNHRQPMLGDSDDSDIRGILTYAAWLFGDSVLKYGGHAGPDYDNAWLFGIDGIREYKAMVPAEPPCQSRAFTHSGHYTMRTGWDEDALYLYFHCGPLGGGHGHADMLHVDLHAYGRDLLTDLGRYNYSDHTPLRKALKDSSAHNTTVVDGIGFTGIKDTWSFDRIAAPLGCKWVSRPEFDYVEGAHDGYLYGNEPLYPRRRIIFVKPYFWLLIDSLVCLEQHTFTQHFHFPHPPGEVGIEAESLICRTNTPGEANLSIIPVRTDGLRGEVGEGVISREYNLLEPNANVTYSRTGKGLISIMQVLYPHRPGETASPRVHKVPVYRHTGERVHDGQAEACGVQLPGMEEEFILVVSHRAPSGHYDSYVVEGMQLFGEVVLITLQGGKKQATVII